MPLALVLGPANSAKAGEVLGAYALAARRDALLVVPTTPDVQHYQRELAAPGVTLGRTLTFSGLIDEIAVRAGYRSPVVTALQRERVLQRAIASVQFRSVAASASSPGFARAAGRLVAELQEQRVTAPRFGSALRSWAGAASERQDYAEDLSAIYRAYLDALQQLERIDAERFAWDALDALREQPQAWGATPVFIYGFDDLTEIELDAVETLSIQADARVTVSLTYEPGRPALAARATVVEELRGRAESVSALPALDEYYEPSSRAALHHLERFLFEPDAPTLDPGDAVTLLEAGGERAEAELVAAEVSRALADGVAAEEIVVVCRSLTRSAERFERALERYGIVATSAREVTLAQTALGRALLALIRYALSSAERRSVSDLIIYMRYPGVVDSAWAVDRFEAEVRRSGLPDVDRSSLAAIAVRPALVAVDELTRESRPLAALPALVRRLLAAPHRGSGAVLGPDQALDASAAAAVLGALAQLAELGEGRTPSGAELVALLEGLPVPVHRQPLEGSVLVSDPAAIRARRFRRVFITGLCEGEFPSGQASPGNPFIDDERRRELALVTGLVLPPEADRLDRERYLLYAGASRATERVTFSYRSSDEDGNLVSPSPFLEDVAELFIADWRERRHRRLLGDVVWSVEEAPTDAERALAAVFARGQARPTPAAASGAGGEPATSWAAGGTATRWPASGPATRTLSPEALEHVRHSRIGSAGALEAFAACPVRWLVERQLRCRDLEPEPEPLARGSLMHDLLERVFSSLRGPLDLKVLPVVERTLRRAIEAGGHQIAVGRPEEVRAAVLSGVEAELRRYLLQEAVGGCDWPPSRLEFRFGLDGDRPDAVGPLELTDGEQSILVSGVIDRIDSDPAGPAGPAGPVDPQRVIVRDYKSGARRDTWPGSRWLSDAQLQVAIYMLAAERLLGKRPVAGFYQPLAGQDIRARGVYQEGVPVGENSVARDALSAEALEVLLEEIETEAVTIGVTLRRGELTPCPETCSRGGCRYPGICWADEVILV